MKAFPLDSALAGQRFVVFQDPRRDDLSFLTPEKFDVLANKILKLELCNAKKAFMRCVFGSAYEITIDENGVAWLPDYLFEIEDVDH